MTRAFVLALMLTLGAQAQVWKPGSLPAWDGPVDAITVSTSGTVYAASNGTGVYQSTDGVNWSFTGVPAEPGIESLLAIGSALYAGTHNGMFASQDGGLTWASTGTGLPTNACAFSLAEAGGYLYAATDTGIYRQGLGGTLWSIVAPGYEFRALFVSVSGALFAGSTSGGNGGGPGGDIWRSADGVTWSKYGLTNAWSVRSFGQDSSGTLYAGAFYKQYAAGGLYTSTDDGMTWTGPVLNTYSVNSITTNGSTVYLGTRDGVLFTGPGTWTATTNPAGKAILYLNYPYLGSDGLYRIDTGAHPALGSRPSIDQVLQTPDGTRYYRSDYFGVYSSTAGYIGPTGVETSWHLDDSMWKNPAGEIVLFDEMSAYHLASGAWIKATFSGGTPGVGRLYCFQNMPDGSILICDTANQIWKSTDGGSTFTFLSKPTGTGIFFTFWYDRISKRLYGASELEEICYSTDGGVTWTILPSFITGEHNVNTYSVIKTRVGTLLAGRAGGNGSEIFRYSPATNAWTESDSGISRYDSIYQLYNWSDGVYAVGGKALYTSADNGVTWTIVAGVPAGIPTYTQEFGPMPLTTLNGHLAAGFHVEGIGYFYH